MSKALPENVKAYHQICRMKDGYGLLGFSILEKSARENRDYYWSL